MLAASWPEAIGESPEILFINLIEDRDHGMLDDFVLSAFALNVIINWVDPEIVRAHWRGEEDLLETIKKGIKNAELLVPDAILKKIQAWVGKQTERALVPVEVHPPVVTEQPKRKRSSRPKK